jgi:hypothetical protein
LDGPVGRKQRDGSRQSLAVFEHLNGFLPGCFLPIIDLSQVQDMPLHHFASDAPLVFDDAPIPVLFALFLSRGAAQEHFWLRLYRTVEGREEGRSALQRLSGVFDVSQSANQALASQNNSLEGSNPPSWAKSIKRLVLLVLGFIT